MDTINNNILVEYINGNCKVTIHTDGTKIREYDNSPSPAFPETIDVKITNNCDLNCVYCHEESEVGGTHADLNILLSILSELPAGVELAIGGGNPLSHPDLLTFLNRAKSHGFICNITVNQHHISPHLPLIKSLIQHDLIKGLGISIKTNDFTDIIELMQLTPNIVFHVIAGFNNISIIDEIMQLPYAKVLVLGYKVFGRGKQYYTSKVEDNVKEWFRKLPSYFGKLLISFDNLAIEQLKIQRLFTKEGWDKFYMGDDFIFSMYIDAVKQQYSPTSRSNKRVSFSEKSLIDYFINKE